MAVATLLAAQNLANVVASNAPVLFGLGATGAWLGPLQRSEVVAANVRNPNVCPQAGEIIDVYYRGGCTQQQMIGALRYQGIAGDPNIDPFFQSLFWKKIIDIKKPQVPIDVVLRAVALGNRSDAFADFVITRNGYRFTADRQLIASDSNPLDASYLTELYWRGIITRDDLVKYLAHAGYRSEEIRNLLIRRSNTLDVGYATELYWRGEITRDDLDKYLGYAGYRSDDIRDLLIRRANPIAIGDAIVLKNRGLITDAELTTYIRWAGLVGQKEIDATKRLADAMPGIGEVLDMASKKVFDDVYAARMQLDADRDDAFYAFAKQLGYDWSNTEANANAPGIGNHTIADYIWRAKWGTVSIGIASELLHRLRPTGGINGGPRVPGVNPFTTDDYDTVLATNNVAPGIREQLSAVSYAIPQRLLVKRLYAAGIIDRAEVKEVIQDQGYNVDNAERLTKLIEHEEIQANVNRLRPLTVSQIKDGYAVGSLSRNDAARYLQMVYDSDYVTVSTFMGYSPERQLSIAQANPWVTLALNAIDTDVNSKLLAKAIEVVRKTYLRAEIDAIHARDQLVSMGIVFTRAQTYVQLWSYELAAEGAETTASQLIDFYVQGLIDELTVTSRLIRLHYSATDIALLLARANIKISQRQAKILAAQQNATKKQAESLAKTQRQLASQMASNAKALCKSSSKAQLVKWATKGLINYADAYKRLTQCGMAALDAVSALAIGAGLSGDKANEQIIQKIGDAFQGATDTATHPAAKPATTASSTTGNQ